jgi:hypothetical protein
VASSVGVYVGVSVYVGVGIGIGIGVSVGVFLVEQRAQTGPMRQLEGAACGQSLEGFAQMQCSAAAPELYGSSARTLASFFMMTSAIRFTSS